MPPKYADHSSQPAIESMRIRASVVMSHPQPDRVDLPVEHFRAEFDDDLFQHLVKRATDHTATVSDMD